MKLKKKLREIAQLKEKGDLDAGQQKKVGAERSCLPIRLYQFI